MSLLTVDFGLSGRKNIVKDGARYPLITGCDHWYLELIGIASPCKCNISQRGTVISVPWQTKMYFLCPTIQYHTTTALYFGPKSHRVRAKCMLTCTGKR